MSLLASRKEALSAHDAERVKSEGSPAKTPKDRGTHPIRPQDEVSANDRQIFVARLPEFGQVIRQNDCIPVTSETEDELRIGWAPVGNRLYFTRGGPGKETELYAHAIDPLRGQIRGGPELISRLPNTLPGLLLYQFSAGLRHVFFQISQETSNIWISSF